MEADPDHRDRTVVLVAPAWLQDAIQILFDATSGVSLVATASEASALGQLELEAVPDCVLLDASPSLEAALDQLKLVRATWPEVDILALVEDSAHGPPLVAAGAAMAVPKGASPERLKSIILSSKPPTVNSSSGYRLSTND